MKFKKAQDQESKILSAIQNKSGQEEMIGFALIIILVAVILLAFLGFSLSKPQKDLVESYEVDNFIQAFLQYTTTCEDYKKHFTIQDLIFECYSQSECLNEESSCEVLNNTLKDLLKESWLIGENRPNKGYELMIYLEGSGDNPPTQILEVQEGNITRNCKGDEIPLPKKRKTFYVSFKACA